jgi:3-polyprenyl-4-hydroxybenzoate decarboxylase
MIEIDASELCDALEDHNGGVHYHLDRQTGELLRMSEYVESDEEIQEMTDRMDEEPGRWVEIEPLESSDSFRIMEDFAAGLPDGEQKRTLQRALTWKKPFSNFKQALYEMPELKQQWHAFHDERIRKVAEAWLAAEGIAAKLK